MESETDLKITTYILAESVAARLRMEPLKCRGVQIGMRFPDLSGCERQARLDFASCTSDSIAKPNILNVAATRAKFRFYVVGDMRVWEKSEIFQIAKDSLKP